MPPWPIGQFVNYCNYTCYIKSRWLVNCTCTNGQGPPPAAKRPGRGDPDEALPGGLDADAVHRDCGACGASYTSKQGPNPGCFRTLPVRSSEGAGESDSVHSGTAYLEERRAI